MQVENDMPPAASANAPATNAAAATHNRNASLAEVPDQFKTAFSLIKTMYDDPTIKR